MISVNVYYSGTPTNVYQFIEEIKTLDIISQVQQINGNIHFDFYESISNESSVVLIDKWDTIEAQDEYHNSQMFEALVELRIKYNLNINVEKQIR